MQQRFGQPVDSGSRPAGWDGLPGGADVIQAELIGVAGPGRRRQERSGWQRTGVGRIATILMRQRIHQVLAHTPGISLTHVSGRRHDDSRGMAILHVVVIAVPGPLVCMSHCPELSDRVRVSRLGGGGEQATGGQHRRQEECQMSLHAGTNG